MEGRGDKDAALRRVLALAGLPDLLTVLAERLEGSELTTLLMDVMRRRAARVTPADVLRRYASDRFVAPAGVPYTRLRTTEDHLLSVLPAEVELIGLAPLVPLGTHSAVSAVDQNRVLATIRPLEVAADPTNGLALEAAVRRRRSVRGEADAGVVRLAAVQRVTRVQRFEGERVWAHFTILGSLTAGRTEPNRGFERRAIADQIRFVSDGLLAAGADRVVVSLSDFTGGRLAAVNKEIRETAGRAEVTVIEDPDRTAGRGYYDEFAFDFQAVVGRESISVADGGLVNWGKRLVASDKERMLISGIGVDRVAAIRP